MVAHAAQEPAPTEQRLLPVWKIRRAINILDRAGDEYGIAADLAEMLDAAPVAAQAQTVPESVTRVLNKLWDAVQGMEHIPIWQEVDQARRDLGLAPTAVAEAEERAAS